jgi:spore germination cell wall hydrolase CwlJ-like protein
VTANATPPDLDALVEARSHDIDSIDAETRCMAKVVHREAANQSLRGQLAVAEVIVNRTRSSIFPTSACAVANQRGQFSKSVDHVAHDRARWRTAVAIARLAQCADAPRVAPGALYFHASYVRPAWSHKRERIARIGGQIFYR